MALIHSTAKSQNVFQNYIDGELYFKIKNEVAFNFNKTSSIVDVNNSLPYVKSVFDKTPAFKDVL